MFVCQSCQKQVESRVPCHLIVEQATFRHPFRPDADMHWEWDERKQKWKWVWYNDKGGPGTRIVKELKVCPTCAGSKNVLHNATV